MSPADLEPLASIAAEVAAEWGVELGPPFALSRYSYVAPAGDDAVLKVTPAEDDESDEEADALELWDGDGAVRLLRRDRGRRALLIERARPGDDISGLPEDEATAIAVAVGHAPVAAGGGALSLDRRPRAPLARPGGGLRSGRARADPARPRAVRLARGRQGNARARGLPPPQHPSRGRPLPRDRHEGDARRAGVRRPLVPPESARDDDDPRPSPSGGSPPLRWPASIRSGCAPGP